MEVEKIQVQMRKGTLDLCVLLIIARGEAYASDMLSELSAAKLIVVEGTLYPLLTRLKNGGLLDYHWIESATGPPRKYYRLTPQGQGVLEALNQAWDELAESIQKIKHKSSKLK